MKETVVIAGASGFIGRWFIERFHNSYDIIALSRKEVEPDHRPNVTWKKVDMYSMSSTKAAIGGADYALYLVHSMAPSTRLNQGTFEDTDLLLADNFARSAEACGLKQIIFVGGILPKDHSKFSLHLRSRYETELTLGSKSTPLTAIRAGIIIGPGGSSFTIVRKLVDRLPVMACPQWTISESQPVDVEDVLHIIDQCFGNEKYFNTAIEVGGKEVISYMDLLKTTANVMDKKRMIFSIPFFTLGFSKLWVGLFSDSSPTFVSPLIESLRHDMTVGPEHSGHFDIRYKSIKESIRNALDGNLPGVPKSIEKPTEKNTVRSYQRLPNPSKKTAIWVAEAYPKWLTSTFKLLLRASSEDGIVKFKLLGITLLKLRFIEDRSDNDRQLFYIIGGRLAKRKNYGWLEFRSVLENRYVISAIHEFVPALPWYIYRWSQAVIHLWVMKEFGRFLSRQG